MSRSLDKSRKVSTNLKNLDSLNLAKSRLKSLDFKNLDREKKLDLDMKDILDGFQKLVSTDPEILISILIGLDSRDPQA
jgi:hypothetical protein